MRYGSACSGIEAATVAWEGLGWQPQWFSEIEPYCCSLLSQRYPTVPNLGDLTKIGDHEPAVDLLVAGSPCVAFSINVTERAGLADPRGQLALHFVRLVGAYRPRWVVWENVPGCLSSNGGRDFGAFTGSLLQCGYSLAWRVLDSRHWGVAQRRRRVFVVAREGGGPLSRRAAFAALFDFGTVAENVRPVREKRQARLGGSVGAIGWTGDSTPKYGIEVVPTLRSGQGGEGVGLIDATGCRRLTVTEWEKLMGFPVGYTAGEHNGKPATDRQRKFALGNSFVVPVVRWIGERIQFVDDLLETRE